MATNSTETYQLSERPQLIDLNKHFKNFRLEFRVTSKDPEGQFETIVLTQKQLDNTDMKNISMKNAIGQIGGKIVVDNNQYENYFLLLRSKTPLEVQVHVTIEQIAGAAAAPTETTAPVLEKKTDEEPVVLPPQPITTPFWKKPVFWILLMVVGAFLLYYYYFYNKHMVTEQPITTQPITTQPDSVAVEPATDRVSNRKRTLYNQLTEIV